MNFIRYLIFIFLICLGVNCASYNQTVKCIRNKEITENLATFQNGYYINLPRDWVAYKDIHCNLVYSPKENVTDLNTSNSTVVSIYGPNIMRTFKSVQNIDELTHNSINLIHKNFGNPEIFPSKLIHEKYGKYTTLRFKTNILGDPYVFFSANYYFEGLVYKISCSAKERDFNKYIEDFQRIIDSFEILESKNR